ncbi:hypothetical protein MKD49_13815 [Herbaspirillum sp. WGmk3]|uniref:hypothetical protein n=1 Tax=Herbaspirillum sp. WGmk3 TaxID=2919925 RepID=UPI0020911CA2|nr:hypothetical protein [Herbaspirillum sp. WGmk3]MCO4857559.1 hypothetical protein [Herbaspirillum sp. WGmk3]
MIWLEGIGSFLHHPGTLPEDGSGRSASGRGIGEGLMQIVSKCQKPAGLVSSAITVSPGSGQRKAGLSGSSAHEKRQPKLPFHVLHSCGNTVLLCCCAVVLPDQACFARKNAAADQRF